MPHTSHRHVRSVAGGQRSSHGWIARLLLGAALALAAALPVHAARTDAMSVPVTAHASSARPVHGEDGGAPVRPPRASVIAKARRPALQAAPVDDRAATVEPRAVPVPPVPPKASVATVTVRARPGARPAGHPVRDPRLSLYPGQAPPRT